MSLEITIETLDLRVIQVDRYQRKQQPQRVRTLGPWDPYQAGLFKVRRREDGSLWMIDGQHRRLIAMRTAELTGDESLYFQRCEVLSGKDDYQGEAEIFTNVNDKQKRLTALESYRGAVHAGREPEATIDAILSELGLQLQTTPSPKYISAVSTLRNIVKAFGADVLHDTLYVIQTAFEGVEEPYWKAPLIDGVGQVLGSNDDVDLDRLVDALGKIPPRSWMHNSSSAGGATTRRSAIASAVTKAYNRHPPALRGRQRLVDHWSK